MTDRDLLCGIDRLILQPDLLDRSLRYALLTNTVSVDRTGQSVKKAILQTGLSLTQLYSPEHGVDATGEDGQRQADQTDPETGIPIISLYGDRLVPGNEPEINYDALVFDLPNVGVRFYTYLWTMSLMMEWCAAKSVPMIVLDRPNPLGGNLDPVEGPMLMPEFFSFIGRWNIPIRFSLTTGELALVLKAEKGLYDLSLRVIPVTGWSRNQTIDDYAYPFKPPSPALLSKSSLWTYPALCFLEATNVSEGRNGPHSFEVAYAPFIQGQLLESVFHTFSLKGIHSEFYSCIPAAGKYRGQTCEGIRLIVTDPILFRPIYTGLIVLAMIRTLYPNQFAWNNYPTHVNPIGNNHFELLTGTRTVKAWMENEPLNNLDQLATLLLVPDWASRVETFLLYP